MAAEQLPLELTAGEPLGFAYFGPHSGVGECLSFLLGTVDRVISDRGYFQSVFVYGVAGVGKTHLLSAFAETLRLRGAASDRFTVRELGEEIPDAQDDVGDLIDAYERQKSRGGIFLVSARFSPDQFAANPHVASRLKSGAVFELRPPGIDEVRPTLISLLERRNLKLSDRAIEYLVRRSPTNPLSLWAILAKIDDRALRSGRAVGLNFIREILGEI